MLITCKITNSNTNVDNTINTYKKFIKSQISEKTPENEVNLNSNANTINYEIQNNDNKSDSNAENSEHDSIVYTKNIKDEPEILDESNGKNNENNNSIHKKPLMTVESITSSEFREGCKGIDSFMSTVRNNSTTRDIVNGESDNNNTNNQSSELEVKNIKVSNI